MTVWSPDMISAISKTMFLELSYRKVQMSFILEMSGIFLPGKKKSNKENLFSCTS